MVRMTQSFAVAEPQRLDFRWAMIAHQSQLSSRECALRGLRLGGPKFRRAKANWCGKFDAAPMQTQPVE
jgi:hypothetical protein